MNFKQKSPYISLDNKTICLVFFDKNGPKRSLPLIGHLICRAVLETVFKTFAAISLIGWPLFRIKWLGYKHLAQMGVCLLHTPSSLDLISVVKRLVPWLHGFQWYWAFLFCQICIGWCFITELIYIPSIVFTV